MEQPSQRACWWREAASWEHARTLASSSTWKTVVASEGSARRLKIPRYKTFWRNLPGLHLTWLDEWVKCFPEGNEETWIYTGHGKEHGQGCEQHDLQSGSGHVGRWLVPKDLGENAGGNWQQLGLARSCKWRWWRCIGKTFWFATKRES